MKGLYYRVLILFLLFHFACPAFATFCPQNLSVLVSAGAEKNKLDDDLIEAFKRTGQRGQVFVLKSAAEPRFEGAYILLGGLSEEAKDLFNDNDSYKLLKNAMDQGIPVLYSRSLMGEHGITLAPDHKLLQEIEELSGLDLHSALLVNKETTADIVEHELQHYADANSEVFKDIEDFLFELVDAGILSIEENDLLYTIIKEQRAYARQANYLSTVVQPRPGRRKVGLKITTFLEFATQKKNDLYRVFNENYIYPADAVLMRLKEKHSEDYEILLQLFTEHEIDEEFLHMRDLLPYPETELSPQKFNKAS